MGIIQHCNSTICQTIAAARLARLTVERGDATVSVITCNVGCFGVDATQLEVRRLDIDGHILVIPHVSTASPRFYFQRDSGRWTVGFHFAHKLSPCGSHTTGRLQILSTTESTPVAQRSTNPYSILRSSGRLKIVVSGGRSDRASSIAQRLANDLLTYFMLDTDIMPETEALETQSDTGAGTGNIVVIGDPSGQYIRRCLAEQRTAFTVADQENGPPVLQLRGEPLNKLSQGNIMQSRAGFVHHTSHRCHVHASTRILSLLHNVVHNRA